MAYNFDKEQLEKIYSNLPEKIREIYSSEETSRINYEIGTKYHLHIDAIGQMGELIGLTLMGLVPTAEFNKELAKRIGVSFDIANLIVYDLNQQIFSKIRKELEELSQRPTQAPTTPQIYEERMTNIANVPKQEVAVTPQTGDNKIRDPYREYVGDSM